MGSASKKSSNASMSSLDKSRSKRKQSKPSMILAQEEPEPRLEPDRRALSPSNVIEISELMESAIAAQQEESKMNNDAQLLDLDAGME